MATAAFWEDPDLLNQIASFLDARSIGAVSCTCRFTRNNLRNATQLRWLAELRGLDPERDHISSVEHIYIAETMASVETSIAFEYQSYQLQPVALPHVVRVADMLVRHPHFNISIEAHCGLEAPRHAAIYFTKMRALSVKRAMLQHVAAIDPAAAEALRSRIITRAFGNYRPLVWTVQDRQPGAGITDRGEQNRRVELYLKAVASGFEAPKRSALPS